MTYYLTYIVKYKKNCKIVDENFEINDLIFINKKGKLIPTNTVDRKWREFKEENNINSKIRIHDLRRYFATFMIRNNVHNTVAKYILGHANINMIEYYQNDDISIQKEFISNLKFALDI
ncbi:MAG: tyrosine-type recombinase/integrase [Clostridia bacterium]|nr:tyrosine-type recombinase/integrase [Clostridia bacterium]